MREEARDYYEELARDYPARIRQLVPAYDDMASTLVGLLAREALDERTILDLGVGEGSLALRVLRSLRRARLTGVDASPGMLERARRRLEEHAERIRLVESDLDDLDPDRVDAAYTSLTLHNLPRARKVRVLRRVRAALPTDGVFVWADLVRHSDPRLQEHFVRERMHHARRAGCPRDLVEWNFRKEGSDDFPLTVRETHEVAETAGFGRASTAWLHDTFAVVVLRK